MSVKRALLFANGEIKRETEMNQYTGTDVSIIAVDGGLRHCLQSGLKPDLLIGDLDSVDPSLVQELTAADVRVEKFPVEKNETDLDLAVLRALQMGAQELVIFGGLGGRLDHTLGNLGLLFHPSLLELSVKYVDGNEEIFAIRSSAGVTGKPGDLVSLIPWGGNARGVCTSGLAYPLNDEELFHYRTRGISNVMLADTAHVTVKDGALLCMVIHTGSVSA